MDIPLGAQVRCSDGVCGRSVSVLVNPVVEQVTHLVVREDTSPHTQYVVPVSDVSAATPSDITLSLSRADLESMGEFVQTEFIEEKVPDRYRDYGGMPGLGTVYYWPYSSFEHTVRVAVKHDEVPAGELEVRRGTRVKARDGDVGRVDELVVDPESGKITHLVMREGHLWRQKEIAIPISAVSETREDAVVLNLDKRQIEALPPIPLHRRWL